MTAGANTCALQVHGSNGQVTTYGSREPPYSRAHLRAALRHCLRHGGDAAGLDGLHASDLRPDPEAQARLLERLYRDLRDGSYEPCGARRCQIKQGEKCREFGIPNIRDRVVLHAGATIVGKEIWPKLSTSIIGGRPDIDSRTAVDGLTDALAGGPVDVLKGDVRNAFPTTSLAIGVDTIRSLSTQDDVMEPVFAWYRRQGKRFADGYAAPGLIVGAPTSPLLLAAVLGVHVMPHLDALGERAYLVVDDGIVVTRERRIAEEAKRVFEVRLDRLGLTLHPKKTQLHRIDPDDESISACVFLGFSWRRGLPVPSLDAQGNLIGALDALAQRADLAGMINEVDGWASYFSICTSAADIFAAVDRRIDGRFGHLARALPSVERLATGRTVPKGSSSPTAGGGVPSSSTAKTRSRRRKRPRMLSLGCSGPSSSTSYITSPTTRLGTAGSMAPPGAGSRMSSGSPASSSGAGSTGGGGRPRARRFVLAALRRCASALSWGTKTLPEFGRPEVAVHVDQALTALESIRQKLTTRTKSP